jgi:hypothetical protein
MLLPTFRGIFGSLRQVLMVLQSNDSTVFRAIIRVPASHGYCMEQ